MSERKETGNTDRKESIRVAKIKIQKMRKNGLITEREKNMLKRAAMVSDEKLKIVTAQIIVNTMNAIGEEQELENASHLTRLAVDIVSKQALSGRLYKGFKDVSVQEMLKTLELYLKVMTNEATHDLSIVLGASTLSMIENFLESEPSIMSALSVRIKSIYVPNNPALDDGVIDLLFKFQERYGIPYFEGPGKIGEFAESAKRSSILIAEEVYGPEINELIIEAICNGSIIVSYDDLEFKGEDAHALNCAVEISPFADNSMVMLYKHNPVKKPGIDLVSEQLDRHNKSVKVSVMVIPLGGFPFGGFPFCFE